MTVAGRRTRKARRILLVQIAQMARRAIRIGLNAHASPMRFSMEHHIASERIEQ